MFKRFGRTAALFVAAGGVASLANAQNTLSTIYVGTNGGSAGGMVYFDVVVGANPITVTGIEVNTTAVAATSFGCQIYSHAGTYVGTTTNSALWTQVATGTGVAAGTDLHSVVTLGGSFVLPANTTSAIAISLAAPPTAAPHRYTNGNGTNQTYSDANITLNLGGASNAAFGTLLTPRVWNGTIKYDVGGVTGRCCLTNGNCVVTSTSGCTAAGGIYAGDGTDCAVNVCPQPPTGACCFPLGNCNILTAANCTSGGGVYSGDNVTCAAANCPQPPPGGDVYAIDNRNAAHPLLKFPVNAPAYTQVGTVTPSCFAMDFNGDGSVLYVMTNNATVSLQELGTLNTTNGAYTTIGLISGAGAAEANWGGMSFDKSTNTMYAIGIAAGLNNLYTVDLATGSTTLVAPITGLPAGAILIDFSINDAGTLMVGHEIVADQMWSINKTTGVATLLGATGFSANFAQGMDFDPTTGRLYATIYVGAGVGSFVQVNTTTGACTTLAVTTSWGAGAGAEMEMAIKGLAVACYANCDGSTSVPVLTANDFQCFLNAYAGGDTYANCDGSTAVPVLTANDFQCFLNAYAAGCS